MKNSLVSALLIGAVSARPGVNVLRQSDLAKREVPQEHSHRNINIAVNEVLQLNNPDNIQDPVFGLLGAKAAAEGAGNIADADCLQQAVADQAFTNAKEAGNVDGMVNALIYRALERNTGSVGLASVPCVSLKAVNPEIAALQQHQDPAGDGAQELNKQIAAELARQIAGIGGDPTLANLASTFAPGKIGDPTAAGNTCDDENDDNGCIQTLGLRVDDLSEDEILAAVADAGGASGAQLQAAAGNATAVAGAGAANVSCAAAPAPPAPAKKAKGAKAAKEGRAGAFGACNPTIVFGLPSDGRKEDAFEPADLATFNHGSALNIAVISNFICTQIGSKCDVGAAAIDTCNSAAAAANGLKAQAAADAFNSALGL